MVSCTISHGVDNTVFLDCIYSSLYLKETFVTRSWFMLLTLQSEKYVKSQRNIQLQKRGKTTQLEKTEKGSLHCKMYQLLSDPSNNIIINTTLAHRVVLFVQIFAHTKFHIVEYIAKINTPEKKKEKCNTIC